MRRWQRGLSTLGEKSRSLHRGGRSVLQGDCAAQAASYVRVGEGGEENDPLSRLIGRESGDVFGRTSHEGGDGVAFGVTDQNRNSLFQEDGENEKKRFPEIDSRMKNKQASTTSPDTGF